MSGFHQGQGGPASGSASQYVQQEASAIQQQQPQQQAPSALLDDQSIFSLDAMQATTEAIIAAQNAQFAQAAQEGAVFTEGQERYLLEQTRTISPSSRDEGTSLPIFSANYESFMQSLGSQDQYGSALNLIESLGMDNAGPSRPQSVASIASSDAAGSHASSSITGSSVPRMQLPAGQSYTLPGSAPLTRSNSSTSARASATSSKGKGRAIDPSPPPYSASNAARSDASADQTAASLHRKNSKASGSASMRHKWTAEETQALQDGCNKHGVGCWTMILEDPEFSHRFVNRTAGDLKDRFRTYFTDAYHELYPNAKTHRGQQVRSKDSEGKSIFEKGKGTQKRKFTEEETKALYDGYLKYGTHWALIGKDPVFQGLRSAGDLRDRFRNAFRDEYEQAVSRQRAKRKQASGSRPNTESSATASVSSNASVSGGEWSLSDATSDGNLTDQSSISQKDADGKRKSEAGPQRRRTSVRSARKSEGGYSDASSRASSFSQPVRPPIFTSSSQPNRATDFSLAGNQGFADSIPVPQMAGPSSFGAQQPPDMQALSAAELVGSEPGQLRRSQSSKRANPRISDREFGRFSASMMLNTARGSAHPLTEDNLQSQNTGGGGGGFPWLSAAQMQIAMQLQAQMSGSALYLGGEVDGNGSDEEDAGYEEEEEDDDDTPDQEPAQDQEGDALFSAPTLVQKAIDEFEASDPLTGRTDPNFTQLLAEMQAGLQAGNMGIGPEGLAPEFGSSDGQNVLQGQGAEDIHTWQNLINSMAGLTPSAGLEGFSSPDMSGDRGPNFDSWEAVQGTFQAGQGQANDFSEGAPVASQQPGASGRRSTDTLREPIGSQQPSFDLSAFSTDAAAATFDERGFDPASLAQWLDNQADLDNSVGQTHFQQTSSSGPG